MRTYLHVSYFVFTNEYMENVVSAERSVLSNILFTKLEATLLESLSSFSTVTLSIHLSTAFLLLFPPKKGHCGVEIWIY